MRDELSLSELFSVYSDKIEHFGLEVLPQLHKRSLAYIYIYMITHPS